jgi:hypothetical protein
VNALFTDRQFVCPFDAIEFVVRAGTLQWCIVYHVNFLGHVFESGQDESWLWRQRMQSISHDLLLHVSGPVADDLISSWRFHVPVRILRLEVLVHFNPCILVPSSYYLLKTYLSAHQKYRLTFLWLMVDIFAEESSGLSQGFSEHSCCKFCYPWSMMRC